MKKWEVFILISCSFIPLAGGAETMKQNLANNRTAAIPALPEALPKISLPSQSPEAWQPKAMEENIAQVNLEQLKREWFQGIYNWLCGQQNSLTGLVESFENSQDPFLKDQGATYDQALAGMAFLILGDPARAKKILDFYQSKWKGKGFYNFYSSVNGRVGMEWRRHVGPNMWLVLFIYQYAHRTKDRTYLPLAEGLCDWVISLPHYNGGVAMSDEDEPEIPWREIVSVENVIDLIAALQMALRTTENFRKKEWYEKELKESKNFIKKVAVDSSGHVARGYRPFIDGIDHVPALDTITWLIASALPENVHAEYNISVFRLLDYAEATFGLDLEKGKGYDYTSKEEAYKAERQRICSVEWSGEMAQVYWLLVHSHETIPMDREEVASKLSQILLGMDLFMQKSNGKISYPYASAPFEKTFSDGWYTPYARKKGHLAGSVASTCWRLFADLWNPLHLDQKKELLDFGLELKTFTEPAEEKIQQALYQPSALTSEGLTTASWMNLKIGNSEEAKKWALECIHLYSERAAIEQTLKKTNGGLIIQKPLTPKIKNQIFRYSTLNDVAACWVILSKVDPSLKKAAAQIVRSKYSLAQIWDPAGFFWIAAEAF